MVVLFTYNQQIKFEMSSFVRSTDMAWTPKCRNGHVTLTTPTWGTVSYHKANTLRGQFVYKILNSLALAIPEIFQGVQNSKMCRVTLTMPLLGMTLLSAGCALLWSTCSPNLKFPTTSVTKQCYFSYHFQFLFQLQLCNFFIFSVNLQLLFFSFYFVCYIFKLQFYSHFVWNLYKCVKGKHYHYTCITVLWHCYKHWKNPDETRNVTHNQQNY